MLRFAIRAAAALAATGLLVMAGATVLDIVLRNLGLGAIKGLIELSSVTVLLLGYLALGHCFAVGGHIAVDIATYAASPRVNRVLDAVWNVVAAAFLAVVAVAVVDAGIELHASGERSAELEWSPLAFYGPAVAGMAVAAAAALAAGLRKL